MQEENKNKIITKLRKKGKRDTDERKEGRKEKGKNRAKGGG